MTIPKALLKRRTTVLIKTELKNQVCRIIDEHAQQIILLTQEIEKIPELGFKKPNCCAVSKFLSERAIMSRRVGAHRSKTRSNPIRPVLYRRHR